MALEEDFETSLRVDFADEAVAELTHSDNIRLRHALFASHPSCCGVR